MTRRPHNEYYARLMLNCLPDTIEPVGLAEAGRSFRGKIAVSSLSRLIPLLSSSEGALAVTLDFGRDERDIRTLTGTISGQVNLVCQRCLDTIRFPLDIHFRLGIVTSEAEIDRLPDGYEPLLVACEPLLTTEVVEDEVLLAIPAIPLHEGAEICETGYQNQPLPDKENPFAVLEKLKPQG